MKRFAEQVAIVTGAGSGIGAATARLLAAEGANVVVLDIVPERVREVVGKITEAGGHATGVEADVRSQKDIERTVSTVVSKHRRIDILVNNAGILFFGGLLDTPEEQWDRMLDTNLRGVYRCSRAVVPIMREAGRGKIVNVASVSATNPQPENLAYATTKGAVATLTRAMGLDLIKYRIFVNAICPGGTRTNINRPASTVQPHEPQPSTPIGYRAEPEDQANVILFLASRESDYMIGQCLIVDGGQTTAMFPRTSPWHVSGVYVNRPQR